MTDQGFETLKVWQKAHAFMLDIHRRLIPLLPPHEKYGLADQISALLGNFLHQISGRSTLSI
jgi:hypothetical protein